MNTIIYSRCSQSSQKLSNGRQIRDLKDIVDNKRIKKILKDISLKSNQRKIDQIVTKKIWKSMIRAFIDYEYRYFKKK